MMPSRREWLALGAVAGLAAAGGAVIGAFALQSGGGAAKLLSARFPDLSGQPRRLRDWHGSVLVCNFWATWCAPCREEVPLLVAVKQQYAAKGVEVVGIGIDDAAKIREFAGMFRVNYPILIAGAEAITLMRELGNTAGGLPYNVVLDRRGAIVHRKLGAFTAEELRQVLDGFLQ